MFKKIFQRFMGGLNSARVNSSDDELTDEECIDTDDKLKRIEEEKKKLDLYCCKIGKEKYYFTKKLMGQSENAAAAGYDKIFLIEDEYEDEETTVWVPDVDKDFVVVVKNDLFLEKTPSFSDILTAITNELKGPKKSEDHEGKIKKIVNFNIFSNRTYLPITKEIPSCVAQITRKQYDKLKEQQENGTLDSEACNKTYIFTDEVDGEEKTIAWLPAVDDEWYVIGNKKLYVKQFFSLYVQ